MSLNDTELALLRTRRTAVLTQLAAMTSSSIGGMPNTSGGESVDHTGYKSQLYAELKELNAMISAAECYEIIS